MNPSAHAATSPSQQTKNFNFQLVKNTQVLASLKPAGDTFDFLPLDYLSLRARNGQYHWGDITFRYRQSGTTAWTNGDSAAARQPVTTVAPSTGILASSRLGPTLPSGSPLNITREWLDVSGDLGLRFTLQNSGSAAIEIGSLGFPAEFNSIFTNRYAADMQRVCSLSDPYVGMHAGQIRVAPTRGTGAALVVTPLGDTPLEAYRNLAERSYEGTYYGSQTLEGFYEWQVLTKAWAENEWRSQTPWNTPSSRTLQPGQSLQFGVRFSVAKGGVRDLDATVRGTNTPTAVGVPGYIIPRGEPAQLFLQYAQSTVRSIASEPAGALTVTLVSAGKYTVTPSTTAWGRIRLTVIYADGKIQTIRYYVTKPSTEAVTSLDKFLTTAQYFNDTSDPFGRAPSVMTYDYETKSIVTQDSRAWVAGLSDEAGAGSYLSAFMKQAIQPNADEVTKLEAFVDRVLWKTIQTSDFTVRKAIFFYEPAATHAWDWYLNQAYETVMRAMKGDVGYNRVGLMGETVFGEILADLGREWQTAKASALSAAMKSTAAQWDTEEVPFGSEMAWDSTGQEGVYYWAKYFGYTNTATKSLNSVLGFMPTVPHWGWNGNARRYRDNIYGGKLRRIERQIHHYGSGLNALVLLSAFRSAPTDTYLLRTGYGGTTGHLSNINQDGFAAASFHSWPDTLKWDGISGDYGPNLLGLALGSGTYVVQDSELGVLAFGGVVTANSGAVSVTTKDAVRRKVFIGPLGVLVSVDAGIIQDFSFTVSSKSVSSTTGTGAFKVTTSGIGQARGGWSVPLSGSSVTVQIGPA
ncbi:hypothetical protein BDP81DRAFT_482429 [Colletotrichum phormii]|uniref:Glycoside hydrolase family 43 protein n=1 Tax=Colletotrichum phormii TaxID=359342 RepID=A0AAJ0EDE9_9PEZI|nr:uncharacterized protein BDP81DRAFT_482429 [Colletotrichum phormii]KAK1634643.1 hypothetical protein BDP81DRAFT_482429 [Colletotrichum phormii]